MWLFFFPPVVGEQDEVAVRQVVVRYDAEFGPTTALDRRFLVAVLAQGQEGMK